MGPQALLAARDLEAPPGAVQQPERRLMLAVLEEAVLTFQRDATASTAAARRRFEEVQGWFASDETASPFSFGSICLALGIEVAYLRAGLARWRQRYTAPGAEPPVLARSPFRRINGSRTRPTRTTSRRRAG
jgi:hypothetical protein